MTTTEITIDTGTNELLCAIRDRVAIITLHRPEVRNALSDTLTPALRAMIKTCGENPEVGALLITGAGTAFCAGGNVKGMGAHRDKKKTEMSYDEKVADLQERQRLLTGALISVRKPTIAALPGPAVGAGLAIAMACDIRIAAESAFVSTGYLRVGLAVDAGGRHMAGAGVDVYLRQGRCRKMRGDWPRQPRGRGCETSGRGVCARQVDGGRAGHRAALHEGQSRRSLAVRFCHRPRSRGGAPDPHHDDCGSPRSGAGLY